MKHLLSKTLKSTHQAIKNKRSICMVALLASTSTLTQYASAANQKDVLDHYADLAHAMYSDSLSTAQTLQQSLVTLTKQPTVENLTEARHAWKAARVPYQQTEVYRFGNAIVDDWEGKVNAWPLDEGLIDYVASSYGGESEGSLQDNPYYTANVIANPKLVLSGNVIDATVINKELLSNTLHEVDGVESNVATGYHAIEFLLWGQDLNGTNAGAGNRPVSDFDVNNCSWGNCDRRNQYLLSAGELLIDDLQWMVSQWETNGLARTTLLKDQQAGIATILTGMGSLSYGELAGERIKLGVLLHDPEEEHDCFSDNTHYSHYYDILGIHNVFSGTYTTVAGKTLNGPSLSQLISAKNAEIAQTLQQDIQSSLAAAQIVVDSAEKHGVAYDQLLAEGNIEGNQKVLAIVDALLQQTKSIESAVSTLSLDGIAFEGSDSLDAPNAVFQ